MRDHFYPPVVVPFYPPVIADRAGRPGDLSVHACPHPFKAARLDRVVPAGSTIAEIITATCGSLVAGAKTARVMVNDVGVPVVLWDVWRPNGGDIITIRVLPSGGDGKDPMRTLLIVGVMVAAAWAGPAMAGAMGLTNAAGALTTAGMFVSGIASAVVSTVGMLAVNAICPPPGIDAGRLSGANTDSPTYSLTGSRNQYRPWSAIPCVLGTHRMVPDKIAATYTEQVGDDQYLYMLFCFGYGPMSFHGDFKIGDTPLRRFRDWEMELRQGFDDDDPITLYPTSIIEDAQSIELLYNQTVVRRTAPDTDKIAVDVTFPQLVSYDTETGAKELQTVDFQVQYAPAGTGNWSLASDAATEFAEREETVTFSTTVSIYSMGITPASLYMDKSDGRLFVAIASWGGVVPNEDPNLTPERAWLIATMLPKTSRSDDNDAFIGLDSITCTDARTDEAKTYFSADSDFEPTFDINLETGVGTITVAAGELTYPYWEISAKTTSTVRRTLTFDPPGTGQWDVRVIRKTADSTSDTEFNKSFWSCLRSIKNSAPITFAVGNDVPLALVALKIKATGQLNGEVDEFSGTVTRICDDYDHDTGTWIERPTDNPASNYRWILQGPATRRPLADNGIDLTGLETWHDFCRTRKARIGYVADTTAGVRDVLKLCASVGFAAPAWTDGAYGVTIDTTKSPVGPPITPRNSWGMTGKKSFASVPHAFKVRFANQRQGYDIDEMIVYDDGYDAATATDFERLDLMGVTDPNLAYKHGRYHLAVLRLRPEMYTRFMDVEGLVFQRGDVVRVQDPTPMWGIKTARIMAVTTDGGGNCTHIRVDDALTMEAGNDYYIRIYAADHDDQYEQIVTNAGDNYTVELTTPIDAADCPAKNDMVIFGIAETETTLCLIKNITYSGHMTACITYVDYSSGIFTARDGGQIPDFDSNITHTQQPDLVRPALDRVVSDESVLLITTAGFEPRVAVTVSIPGTYVGIISEIEVQMAVSGTGAWTWRETRVVTASVYTIYFDGVEQGDTYDIRARSVSSRQARVSDWRYIRDHVCVGQSTPPPDIDQLRLENNKLVWEYPDKPVDFAGFVLRHASGVNVAWDFAEDFSAEYVSSPVPVTIGAGPHTFLLRAKDRSGNLSDASARLVANLGDPETANVYETTTVCPPFVATLADAVYSGAYLACRSTAPTGVAFSSDGTKLYEINDTTNLIYEYDLSTAFDITTAVYNGVYYACQSSSPDDLAFSSDGTVLFELGSNHIYAHDLSTAWDLSTASYSGNSIDAVCGDIDGFFISSAGDVIYEACSGSGRIYQRTLDTELDITTIDQPVLISEDATPRALFLSSDGTVLFDVGYGSDAVNQYDLSTAYDPTDGAYSEESISCQAGSPLALWFKSDGTKMYEVSGQTVYQYTLTSAWDLSTASYDSVSFSLEFNWCDGLAFSADGSKMYSSHFDLAENVSAHDRIYQYTLSTPWDLSTAVYASKVYEFASDQAPSAYPYDGEGNGGRMFFKSDGTRLFIASGGNLVRYDLSSAWDITTLSITSDEYTGMTGFIWAAWLSSDGTKLIELSGNKGFYAHTLSTAWDITTAAPDIDHMDTLSSAPAGIFIDASGLNLYETGTPERTVYRHTLSTAWDITSASSASDSITAVDATPEGIWVTTDRLIEVGSTGDRFYSHDIPNRQITGGTVDGNVLEADDTANYWTGDDDNVIWTGTAANPVWSPQYETLQFEFQHTPSMAGDLLIDADVTAPAGYMVQYRQTLVNPWWAGKDEAWIWTGDDDAPAWRAENGEWKAFTGKLAVGPYQYEFCVTLPGSGSLASISGIDMQLDVPDITEYLNDVEIEAGGTRLPITKTYTAIDSVTLTLQEDAGDAEYLKVNDRAVTGPLVYAYDADGVATTATIDARIKGY